MELLPDDVRILIRAMAREVRQSVDQTRAPFEEEFSSRASVRRHTVDLVNAATVEIAGAGRSVWVARNGDPGVTLVLDSTGESHQQFPCWDGLRIERFPYRRAFVVVPGRDPPYPGSMEIWTSDRETMPQSDRPWRSFSQESPATPGNVVRDASLDEGYEYDLRCATIRLSCDATVATRVPEISVFDPNGVRIYRVARARTGTTASQTGLLVGVFDGADAGLDSDVSGGGSGVNRIDRQTVGPWVAPVVVAGATHVRAQIGAGVAGDGFFIHLLGLRRSL